MSYRCWGDDGEDLTVLVQAALSDYEPVFGLRPRRKQANDKIVVTCSNGHQNVFDVPSGYEKKDDD